MPLSWLAPQSHLAIKLADQFAPHLAPDGTMAPRRILAQGDAAADALRSALATPGSLDAIALIAPPSLEALRESDPELVARLGEIETPILALFGTEDAASPPSLGHEWRRALPKCFLMVVYGAGGDMANERPDALAALITDFFARGENFLVSTSDGRLWD